MLIRKQILLDPETNRDLEYLALASNESFSGMLRKLLIPQLKKEKSKIKDKTAKKKMSGAVVLLKMAENAKKIAEKYGCDYPSDLSINHDHYLYGAPKKKV